MHSTPADCSTTAPMDDELDRARPRRLAAVAAAATLDELRAVETEVLGKRGALARARPASARCRPRSGATPAAPSTRRSPPSRPPSTSAGPRWPPTPAACSWPRSGSTSPRPLGHPRRGHAHLVTQATERLEDTFIGLGFQIAEGPEVETDWHNFEALNMPPSHPARSEWDTLFVDHGQPGSTVLRTHTSPVQIRVMQTQPTADLRHHARPGLPPGHARRHPHAGVPPARGPGRRPGHHLRRPGRHHRGLHQGLLRRRSSRSRLRPSYFPFTEPSAEFDIRRPDGTWLELGGCGMVHPNVLRAVGLDPEEWSGFAFGFGIDRMAKERHGVDDLRDMFANDIRFIEQF